VFFMQEILCDLRDEAVGKSERILSGIHARTFSVVATAAHIVNGSAKFFFCENLITAAEKLIELAREGAHGAAAVAGGQACRDPEAIWVDIEKAYVDFEECVHALNEEMESHFKLLGL